MTTKLKPCPFCGGEVEFNYYFNVFCKGCDSVWRTNRNWDWQNIWNKRHTDTDTDTDTDTNCPVCLSKELPFDDDADDPDPLF